MTGWDKIIITVGTEQQKNFVERKISQSGLSDEEDFEVVNDDEFGVRIGSGGALLNVISKFYTSGKKILIINSGGYSKRSIHYSVKGKLFCSFYTEGKKTTLLESIIANTSGVAKKIKSGALVCCSDILIDLKNTDLDCFDFDDNTGFCIRRPLDECSRHGVFIGGSFQKVEQYAHKKSVDKLRKLTSSDTALIDTGMTYFSDEFLNKIRITERDNNLIGLISENGIELNLYPELVYLLAEKTDKEEYFYEDLQNDVHLKIRKIFSENFSLMSIKTFEIDADKFIHFGTVNESAENIRSLAGNKSQVRINSVVNNDCSIGEKVVLENCYLDNCSIGDNVFISDIMLDNVSVPDNTLVCGIKTIDGNCVAVCCSINENPKDTLDGVELWKHARYYPSETFTKSYVAFTENSADRELVSMEQLIQNADSDYFCTWPVFLENLN